MSQKYYWLKLKEDFFERDEIKVIESVKNGKDYINFYLKLLLKSIKSEGMLRFRETIPFNIEMLSTITNTNIDTVRVALKLFLELNLMEKMDDGTFYMLETKNMIGAESKWAEYKRKERKLDNVQKLSKKCQIEIESEKDLEKDSLRKFSNSRNFHKWVIKNKEGYVFTTEDIGFLPTTKLQIKGGYIFNTYSQKFLNKDESFLVWDYLFKNQEQVFDKQ